LLHVADPWGPHGIKKILLFFCPESGYLEND